MEFLGSGGHIGQIDPRDLPAGLRLEKLMNMGFMNRGNGILRRLCERKRLPVDHHDSAHKASLLFRKGRRHEAD